MKALKERILKEGRCLPGGILKVNSFINHQMDPVLMEEMAEELVRRFSDVQVDKVLTVEASGIAPAIMVGYLLRKPVVFAKKAKPSTMSDFYTAKVFSFTKNREYDICLSRNYLSEGDNVLFIDDFLANGNAAVGVIDLVSQAGADLVGLGFLIEKDFQPGGAMLRSEGYRVESLAIIESLEDCQVKFKE